MTDARKWDLLWSPLEEVVLGDVDREIWRNLAAHVPLRGRTLLELGCGRGIHSRLAMEAGAAAATLVDNSPEALRLARLVFQGIPGVRFVEQDLLAFHSEARFDIVFSSGTVEDFRGEELMRCLRAHRDHCRELVAIVVPCTPHYNEVHCRTRRFVRAFGYERPISVRRMGRLLRRAGLRPVVLKRFYPQYGLGAYWSVPRTGVRWMDSRLEFWLMQADVWAYQRRLPERLIRPLRRLDRLLGGLLLAVAAPERREE